MPILPQQDRAFRVVRLGIGVAAVLVLMLCAGAVRFAFDYVGANAWVTHTTGVIAEVRDTRMLLPGTGVLSGSALQVKAATILEQFARVEQMTRDNPQQQASARQFRAIFTVPAQNPDSWKIDGPSIAAATVLLDRMSQQEERLLTDRIQVQSTATRNGALAACTLCIALLLMGAITGLAARQEFRRRESAESALMLDKEELTRHSRNLALVSAGSELIQAAKDEEQISVAIAQVMHDLLPESRGYFGMISPSNDLVEICGSWGEGTDAAPFVPSDCLALQLGRAQHRDDALIRIGCAHAREAGGDSICIPVRSATGPLGVLHVQSEKKLGRKHVDVVGLFAVHVGLGLTNLRMREALRRQTVRDPLTGLFNRRYFDETLRRELAGISRHGSPLSVIMFDVDHFKHLNDTHGHSGGDDALKTLARVIRSSFRAGDVLCRYGGEEFAVILPGAGLEDSWSRAEAFRRCVEQTELFSANKCIGRLTISLGLATSSEFPEADELMRAADSALYQAKRMGRNATWACSDHAPACAAIPTSLVQAAQPLPSEEALWLAGVI